MAGIMLGAIGKAVTPIAPLIRWILNTDIANVIGISYQWVDASAWDDTAPWKA
jgi:hypothetical protein